MKRELIKALRQADIALHDWAEWVRRYEEGSAIGYPHNTVEARLAEYGAIPSSQPAGAVVPRAFMPHRIAEIERTVNTMHGEMRELIRIKYQTDNTEEEKVQRWCEIHACGKSVYYNALEVAKAWVAGRMV